MGLNSFVKWYLNSYGQYCVMILKHSIFEIKNLDGSKSLKFNKNLEKKRSFEAKVVCQEFDLNWEING